MVVVVVVVAVVVVVVVVVVVAQEVKGFVAAFLEVTLECRAKLLNIIFVR